VPVVRAAVADGVARRILVENCDNFSRVKPGGTASFVQVGDEMFGSSVAKFKLPAFSKAQLATMTPEYNTHVFVGDDVGGATPAYGDGTYWRRVADREIIA